MNTTKTRGPEQSQRPNKSAERPQGTKKRPVQAADQSQRSRPKKAAESKKKQPVQTKKAPPQRSASSAKQRADREERNDVPNKKRVYGKTKPRKKTAIETLGLAIRETAKENAARRRAKQNRSGKKRPSQPTPAIIYTQPQVFNRTRLVIQLVTVLAVVVALVLGMSVFFKVGKITVTGAGVYDASSVIEASGIKMTKEETETEKAQTGEGLFTFSRTRAAALIVKNLPYVKNVSFGIKLPDTVNIIIEEEDVVYSIQDQNEQWWLINSEGRVVEQIQDAAATNYTQVLGVSLKDPIKGQRCEAMERETPEETAPTSATEDPDATQETVLMGSTGAQRLAVALEILKALEDNDIVGTAASVDVGKLEDITLWYGTRYQVGLGDDSRLHEKIDYMNDVIAQMSDYQSGILDISFRIWTNQVGYTPFS